MNIINSPVFKYVDKRWFFLSFIPLNGKVLDIGCGGGRFISRYKSLRPDIEFYGVDISDTTKQLDNLVKGFFVCDISKDILPFETSYFDGFICAHVIEHLGCNEAILHFLKESHRILKDEGYGYIETPSDRSLKVPSVSYFSHNSDGPMNFYDDPTHNYFVHLSEMENNFLKTSLSIISSGLYRNFFIVILALFLPIYFLFINKKYVVAFIHHLVGWSYCWLVKKS